MREAEVVLIVVLLVEQVMMIYEWCLLDIVGCPGRLERFRSRKMDLHRLVLLEEAARIWSELEEDVRRKRRKGSGDLRPDEKKRDRADSCSMVEGEGKSAGVEVWDGRRGVKTMQLRLCLYYSACNAAYCSYSGTHCCRR